MNNSLSPQHELITFARAWAPYGGGTAEDIFVTFGITPYEYFTRLAALLGSTDCKDVAQQERRALLSVCARRIANPRDPKVQHPSQSVPAQWGNTAEEDASNAAANDDGDPVRSPSDPHPRRWAATESDSAAGSSATAKRNSFSPSSA